MSYETMGCCGAVLYGPHAPTCEDAPADSGTSTWGNQLARALGISGLYGYDEASEMEREATEHLERAA